MSSQDTERKNYFYFSSVSTRWMDNDIYGHVNNVTYYSYFDSAANEYLIEQGGLNIHTAKVVGFVVASNCNYIAPISYPGRIDVGFRVNRLGTSSVEYGMAIFKESEPSAVAQGTFTHVFVNRETGKSSPIPVSIRAALEKAFISS